MSLSSHANQPDTLEGRWERFGEAECMFVVKPWRADCETLNAFDLQQLNGSTLAEVRMMPIGFGDRVDIVAKNAQWAIGKLQRDDVFENCVFPLECLQKSRVALPLELETLLLNVDTVLKSWLAHISHCNDSKLLNVYVTSAETLLVTRRRLLESDLKDSEKSKHEIIAEMERGNMSILGKHILRNDDGSIHVAQPSKLWQRHLVPNQSTLNGTSPAIKFWSLTTEFKALDAASKWLFLEG
jgi:hypothetical protein